MISQPSLNMLAYWHAWARSVQAIRAVINGTEMAPTGDYNPANRKRAKGHAASANRRCETPV